MSLKKHIFTILLILVGVTTLVFTRDILAIFTIVITVFIAVIQQYQLYELMDIGRQTKATTEKLKTDSLVNENVSNFFLLPEDKGQKKKKYKCILPVEYRSKPLPFINQGDFYAIHVLSTRLGEDNLDIERITRNESVDEKLLQGNVIFICEPRSNPALKKLFDIKEIRNEGDRTQLRKWPLDELNIPCWFIEDFIDTPNKPVRKIKIYDGSLEEWFKSPAEECYMRADNLEQGKKFICDVNIQRDYGIFARLNRGNDQYIIISGLHQYGTWIVASFLSNLLGGKDVVYKSTFLSNKDFIAVITGEFDNEKLTVNSESIGVPNQYIWTKKDNTWTRMLKETRGSYVDLES
jgi:hypothetical protein